MNQICWNLQDAKKVVIATIAGLILFLWLTGYVMEFYRELNLSKSILALGIFLMQSVLLIAPLYFLIIRKYRLSLMDLGLRSVSAVALIKAVIGGYLSFILFSYIVSALQIFFGVELPGFQKQESPLPLFGNDELSIFVSVITIVIVAPLVEEIFFRGFLLRTFLAKYPERWAIFFSALIFAAAHLEFRSVIPLFALGVIINGIYVKYRSLWPCLAFHVFNNSITLAFLYYLEANPELKDQLLTFL